MPTDRKIRKGRVFVMDDRSMLGDGLRCVIEQQFDLLVCGEAAEASEALAKIPPRRS